MSSNNKQCLHFGEIGRRTQIISGPIRINSGQHSVALARVLLSFGMLSTDLGRLLATSIRASFMDIERCDAFKELWCPDGGVRQAVGVDSDVQESVGRRMGRFRWSVAAKTPAQRPTGAFPRKVVSFRLAKFGIGRAPACMQRPLGVRARFADIRPL